MAPLVPPKPRPRLPPGRTHHGDAGRRTAACSRSRACRRLPLAALAICVASAAALRLTGRKPPLLLQQMHHVPILQPTMDYWSNFAQDWSTRLGVTGVLDDAVPEPVIALLNSTRLSDEEKERLRRQREDYYHDDSIRSVRITVCISLPIFMLSFGGFELMLRSKQTSFWRMLGVPRLVAAELSGASAACSSGLDGISPRRRNNGVTPETAHRQVWCHTADLMRKVLMVDDKKILECAGMDAVVLLRFCALCGRFCAILCFWCLFLSPLYAAGANWWIIGPRQGLTRYTLANLRQGSNILWCVVPAAYLCTLTLCALLWKEYERFVLLRRSYLGGASVPRHEHGSPPVQSCDSVIGGEIPFRRGVTPPPLLSSPVLAPQPSPPLVLNASEVPEVVQGFDFEMAHLPSIGQQAPTGQADLLEQARRTVLVEGVPPEFSDPAVLRAHFEELLGANTVHSIAPVPADSRRLCDLMELRSNLMQDRGSNWQELVQVEETLRGKREMFGRMVIASAFKDRRRYGSFAGHPTDTGSFLSLGGEDEFSADPAPRPVCNTMPHSNVMGSFLPSGALDNLPPAGLYNPRARTTTTLSASGFQELCAAGRIAVRVAVGALTSTASAIRTLAVELAGSSVRRVGQLVPVSALGTPRHSRVNTPGPSALGTPFDEGFFMDIGVIANSRRFSSAYVTFKNLQSACIACQVTLEDATMITGTSTEMTVVPAPEPRDVVWRNAARPTSQRLIRSFGVEVALLLGLAFWSVPVGLLQAWCSLARLQQLLPWMHLTQQFVSSDVFSLLTLYLPVILLLLVLEVLPLGFHWIEMFYEGVKSHSALHLLTMRRYWRFQLATIFVTVLSGSVSDSLKTIVDHPPSLMWELGQSLPKVAVYFLVTVLSSALVVAPVSLLRLPTVALHAGREAIDMLSRCGALLMGRGFRRPEDNENGRRMASSAAAEALVDTPDLAADMSALLFVLLVCVTYATIAPFIMIAGLLFFVVKWQVLALRYLYVCAPRFDSGGRFWYLLWDQALLALVLGNGTTLALVSLRCGYGQIPFLLPLPLLPVLFKLRAEQRFTEASLRLSLRSARTLDAQNPRVAERLSHDAYWHPALRIAEGELRAASIAASVGSTISAPGNSDRGLATSRREYHHWVHASRVLDAVEELQLGLESTTPSRCISEGIA